MGRYCIIVTLLTIGLYANQSPTISTTCTVQGDVVTTTTSDGRSQLIEERSLDGQLHERLWVGAEGQHILHEWRNPTDPFGSAELRQRAGNKERTISWTVGENRHLTTVHGATATTTYEYDALGHCIAKRTSGGREIRYKWDTKDRLTEMYSPDGTIDYQFSYDSQDRICSAYDAVTGHTVTRTFDTQGRLVSDGEEGTTVNIEYDSAGLIKTLLLPDETALYYHGDGLVQRVRGEVLWSVIQPEHLYHDTLESQELLWHTDPLGSWSSTFSYDELNQLQIESGEWNQVYEFDPFGMSSRAEDGTYDADGNLCAYQEEETQWTYTYDALGRLVCAACDGQEEHYRYDGFGRLQEISTGNSSKHLCWFDETDMGTIVEDQVVEVLVFSSDGTRPIAVEMNGTVSSVAVDSRGSIIALLDPDSGDPKEVYRYSAFGHVRAYGNSEEETLIRARCPWLYCGKRWLETAQAYDFAARRYLVKTLRWAERDPLGLVDTPDDRVFVRNNPVAFADPAGLFPALIPWSDLVDSVSAAVKTIAQNMYKSITFAKQRLDWMLEVRSTYEDLFFQLMGQTWLRLMGYNPDPSERGTYGGADTHPKTRITLINGILNGAPEAKQNAALLSSTHGNVPVHFIYAATEGFAGDLLRGFLGKAGVASRQAKMLASLWKELIQEMGGPDGGGVILHYAHSLGATDTLRALQRLDPKERKCIRVATFGAPTLIEDGVCAQVDNYVSVKDGVPTLDMPRYHAGASGNQPNIHFMPSEIAFPMDHLLNGKTYRTVLETLGQKFQEEFLLAQ
jgi:RHS repeat-associated protein